MTTKNIGTEPMKVRSNHGENEDDEYDGFTCNHSKECLEGFFDIWHFWNDVGYVHKPS